MSILFLIVIAILILFSIRGFKKGLFGIVFGVLSWVFIMVCLIYGTPKMNVSLRENKKVYNKVYSIVEKQVSAKVNNMDIQDVSKYAINMLGSAEGNEKIQNQVNDIIKQSLSLLPSYLADQIQEMTESGSENTDTILSIITAGKEEAVTAIREVAIANITTTITNYVISVLAFVLTLFVAWIIVLIVSIIIKIIELNRRVKETSHWLGIIFGLLEGFLLVFILLYIISAVSMITKGQMLENDINKNVFLNFLYVHNPITKIFTKK